LFLSNGRGEDAISCSIIQAFKDKNGVLALPLIGDGMDYINAGIEVVGCGMDLPSGGFGLQGIRFFLQDLKSGLLGGLLRQIKVLSSLKKTVRLTICVGDFFLVLLAILFVRRPIIFFATAKSHRIKRHLSVECLFMKRFCEVVICRDEQTRSDLSRAGINAVCLGNPMLDTIQIKGADFGLSDNLYRIGILPGSRAESIQNIRKLIRVCDAICSDYIDKKDVVFLVSMVQAVDMVKEGICNTDGDVKFFMRDREEIKGEIRTSHGARLLLIYNHFGDVLQQSDIIIGLAGTANEQAVYFGRRVVCFVGEGPQSTRRRFQEQKRLLGERLSFVEGSTKEIAMEVVRVLRYEKKMGQRPCAPQGSGSSSKRIADLIQRFMAT
jgi:uncharacterized protein (TIGR03492 family)